MLLTYEAAAARYHSDYQLKKALASGELHKVERGIYSDTEKTSELDRLLFRYPKAVLTMYSAFFCHGLTDVVPEAYCLAVPSNYQRIAEPIVRQYYVPKDVYSYGIVTMNYLGTGIRIYDKERMLVELLRYKNKLPYDYYKEILWNYRNMIYELDIQRIQEYAENFPKSKQISYLLDMEVF